MSINETFFFKKKKRIWGLGRCVDGVGGDRDIFEDLFSYLSSEPFEVVTVWSVYACAAQCQRRAVLFCTLLIHRPLFYLRAFFCVCDGSCLLVVGAFTTRRCVSVAGFIRFLVVEYVLGELVVQVRSWPRFLIALKRDGLLSSAPLLT